MANRIKLTCTAGTNSESVTFRVSKPPYTIVADNPSDGSWTGSVVVQQSMQTPPQQNVTIVDPASYVTDANVTDWMTVATLATGTMASWSSPLFRVRINGTSVTGTGTAKVYILETPHNPDTASDE